MADCANDVRRFPGAEDAPMRLAAHGARCIAALLSGAPAQGKPREDSAVPLADASHADGGTMLLMQPATSAYNVLSRTPGSVTDAFAFRGRMLNIGSSETAALVARRGEGEKAARREAWRAHDGYVHSATQLFGAARAPIARNYVHLGSAFDAHGPMAKHRASATAAPMQVLRRRVFATGALEAPERLTLAGSLVMSGRLYNAGAWPQLTQSEHSIIHSQVMKIRRTAARVRFQESGPQVSDKVVLARPRRPAPGALPRAARLCQLGSLYRAGPRLA